MRLMDADRDANWSDTISEEPAESETTEQQPGPSGPSILEALKAPRLSEFTRKRKLICNPPPTGQRRARGSGASEPKTVSPRERVHEFPNECLTVTGKQLMELFGDVQPFLEVNTSISPATRGKLLGMLQNPQEKAYLMVELAVTVDVALPFVKATYVLEGDGPLALSCYETISSLNAAARQANYSNLFAVASTGDTDMVIEHAKKCVQPGVAYYFKQLSTNMKEAFKAARLFSPSKLSEMNPGVNAIDSLCSFPFLSPFIPGLKEEFPQYIAFAEDHRMTLFCFGRDTKRTYRIGAMRQKAFYWCNHLRQPPKGSSPF